MSDLPHIYKVSHIKLGDEPELEAWLYHFLMENNLEYLLNPSFVASPEQLRFMVAISSEQIYVPCADDLFLDIYNGGTSERFIRQYEQGWDFIVQLIDSYKMSKKESERILAMCRYRYETFCNNKVLLPSRMIKRLLGIVLTQCGDSDPFRMKKRLANALAAELAAKPDFAARLEACPALPPECTTIPSLRRHLSVIELYRLMVFSTYSSIWKDVGRGSALNHDFDDISQEDISRIERSLSPENDDRGGPRRILFLPETAGGIMLDIVLVKKLVAMGHEVVLALKDAFYFDSPSMADLDEDPLLKQALDQAHILQDDKISKNNLLSLLKQHRLLVVSDGTSENLNLYRTNETFARAWKECDLVIAKGWRNSEIFLKTSHLFTRDIICFWRNKAGEFCFETKAKAPWLKRVSEKSILSKAKSIISQMREAKEAGKTVMFYSAIIGSIPGQTKTAIAVVNTFVDGLRKKLAHSFIINPAEHFEEGMDGDDLMYMWEHVQRSGLLDVWRFQSVDDIEASFSMMNQKVPAVWSGKDSTFSTGCTQEMRIALSEQKKHPEMQIIGPAAEKFFRRRDYGIGKYFDASIRG